MDDICACVGTSKATLYNYFKSKDEIFADAVKKFAEEKQRILCNALSDSEADVENTLIQYGTKILEFLIDPKTIAARRMVIAPGMPKNIAAFVYENGPRASALNLAAYLEKQISAGKLKSADPILIASQFQALVVHTLSESFLYQVRTSIDRKELDSIVKEAVLTIMARYKA